MREKPPPLLNPTESTIVFTTLEFGILDSYFVKACLTHGDEDSFSWTSGGGEYAYAIR